MPPLPADLTGLEQLQAMLAGRIDRPPMALSLNFVLDTISEGRAEFRGAPTAEVANPMGQTHGGWYGAVLDSAMGCAVHATLGRGEGYATLEYKINITRPLPVDHPIVCVGEIQHRGRRTAVANGTIRGADGTLFATGSTTCIIFSAEGG